MSEEQPEQPDEADGIEELDDDALGDVAGGADGGGQYEFPSGYPR